MNFAEHYDRQQFFRPKSIQQAIALAGDVPALLTASKIQVPDLRTIPLWLAVGSGGFAGALIRYALSGWVVQRFPVGTLTVNLAGCLAIGLLVTINVRLQWPGDLTLAFLVAGFLGSLTTFSTFGYQTVILLQQRSPGLAALNIGLNLGAGLLCVWLGLLIGTELANRVEADPQNAVVPPAQVTPRESHFDQPLP